MMKLIIAYIQPDKLNAVKQELFKAEIHKMSVTNALGCGQQMGYTETYRGVTNEVNLLKKLRIEIAVTEPYVEKTVKAIIKGAQSGQIGDGKIFIMPVEEVIRIRSEERGEAAIG
ncbi:MAG TPA: P-II family nitrogen regulator [Fibrobacteraceae bacterium]|nr:P-II family nitrogen regulator [Fibrobacteraceae bacterium]